MVGVHGLASADRLFVAKWADNEELIVQLMINLKKNLMTANEQVNNGKLTVTANVLPVTDLTIAAAVSATCFFRSSKFMFYLNVFLSQCSLTFKFFSTMVADLTFQFV